MPTYEYRCQECSKEFSIILSMKEHDEGKAKCPNCGSQKVEQLISTFLTKTSRKS